MTEVIWYDDIRAFFSKENIGKLWITSSDELETTLNVVLRFAIIYGVVLMFILGETWPLVVPIAAAVLTYATYENKRRHSLEKHVIAGSGDCPKEKAIDESECGDTPRRPTLDNPMMNPVLFDDDTRPADNVLHNKVKREMRAAYDSGIPREARDIFGRNTGERAFYTVPPTDVVNDLGHFARWLFPKQNGELTWKERGVLYHV